MLDIYPAAWPEDTLRRMGDHPVNRIAGLLPHKRQPLPGSALLAE